MSVPLEDYALLGNGETAALLSREGSIDWLCWPRFDDDACLAALLGTSDNGHWSIRPAAVTVRTERRYQDDTLIVETDFETDGGAVRLIDFMPVDEAAPSIVRIVAGLRGTVGMQLCLKLRFDFGAIVPWTSCVEGAMVAKIGPDQVVLRTPVHLQVRLDATECSFDIAAGDRVSFVLSYAPSHEPPPAPLDAAKALERTHRFWRDWIAPFDDARTRWPASVRRALLTLKALTHRRTGGIVAAPTTSLPEAPGGGMNWDYRYCWLRDTSLATVALLNAGFASDAQSCRDWLLQAIGCQPDRIGVVYRVDGGRHLAERNLDRLSGYRHATPVRVGNAAATQRQIDVLGEVLDCLDIARLAGVAGSQRESVVATQIVEHLERVWRIPASGIWESRGPPRHYTYSRVMAWVGLDRFIAGATQRGDTDTPLLARMAALRQTVREEVLTEGWNEALGTFTQYYGGEELDASLLLLPLVGFLPATDARMSATIEAIQRRLSEGGLIRRHQRRQGQPDEGAFLACSCWMADCLAMQGRRADAQAQFERVLAVGNDLGLLAEQYNVRSKRLAGNFPQALTHIAIINTALGLCGPILQRGGG